MAKTKRIEIDVARLEQLDKHVRRLDKKDRPAAAATRERIRLAFLSQTKGDGAGRLEGTLHCLGLIETAAKSDFRTGPEDHLSCLAVAIERLGALAAEMERIEVGS